MSNFIVTLETPDRKASEGFCNWCRNKPGDIFCDGWPICFDCCDTIIEREIALGIMDEAGLGRQARRKDYFDATYPQEWEK